MSKEYKGSCLCGAVRFSVSGFSEKVAHCHCTMCRKFHGAAFGTLVPVKDLHWLAGEDQLKHFTAANGTTRVFCENCGSSLGFLSKGEALENLEVAIACFDDDIPVEIDAHIYTDYKANWCEITDGKQQFPEERGG
ncbi:GFA family protein [Sessilibacter sp. MAH4]